MKKALCVIPARGGSVRIPGKNIRWFCGVSMLARAIHTAKRAGCFDEILVTTDSTKVADVAAEMGCRYIMRELDDGTKGTVEVTRDAALAFKEAEGFQPDDVCCLYPCTPLLFPYDLYGALVHHRSMYQIAPHTIAVGSDPLRDAGAFYWHTWVALIGRARLIDTFTKLWVLPERRVCDINTEDDWQRAEQLFLDLRQGEDNYD